MKTLFLQAPSYDGFDGGAGSRYQAKREIRSFWYPTWLAQPAALVPDSRVLDAPADGLSVEASLDIAQQYELVIIHTSTPSFPTDALFAEQLKKRKPVGADRHGGREGRGRPAQLAGGERCDRFRLPRRIRLHLPGRGAGHAARRRSRA